MGSAKLIAEANRNLTKAIDIRLQKSAENIFKGIIKPTDRFDLTLCNPPFHASQEEADAVGMKKLRNLGKLEDGAKPVLNFGGKTTELWCDGGEERFVRQMAEESVAFGQQCFWFTTLVSKKTTLPVLSHALRYAGATDIKVINMAQGQKASRVVAWTFLDRQQQEEWMRSRWIKA